VLDVSVGTVKSRILRGRRLLREILGPALHASRPETDELPRAPLAQVPAREGSAS
jgi:hypothetical protein